MQREPAVIISTVTAAFASAIGLAIAFGIDISDEQRDAMLSTLGAMIPLLLLVGPIIRQFVYSPRSVENKVAAAYSGGQAGETPPEIVAADGPA